MKKLIRTYRDCPCCGQEDVFWEDGEETDEEYQKRLDKETFLKEQVAYWNTHHAGKKYDKGVEIRDDKHTQRTFYLDF